MCLYSKEKTNYKEKEKTLQEMAGLSVNILCVCPTPDEKCNIEDYSTVGNIYLLIFINLNKIVNVHQAKSRISVNI